MAYQWADTWDYYNTAYLLAGNVWETIAGSHAAISSSYARFAQVGSYPNQGLFLPGPTNSSGIRKNLQSNQGTLIAFLSFGAGISAGGPIISFLDNGTLQCYLGSTASGQLQFYTEAFTFNPVAIGPPSAAGLLSIVTAPNHGIEIKIVFGKSGTGSVVCYLDGKVVIPLTTGLTTALTANNYANQVGLGANGNGYVNAASMYSDYVRVWDTTGSYQNALTGNDAQKLTKLPQGIGAFSQWSPNGAAQNWECVDDASPDGDSTYVSSTGTLTDSYAMGSAGFIIAPTMTVARSLVRKDDSATRTLQVGVLSTGGAQGLGSAAAVGSSYAYTDACISVDPATSLPPTAAAADAFQHLKFEAA